MASPGPLNLIATPPESSDGFTLLELSIAMAIFSVLAMLIMYTLNGFIQVQDQTLNRFYATSQAQNIIDRLGRDLRTAVTPTDVSGVTTPFVQASPTEITFYANLGGTTPTELRAYIAPTTAGSPSCPCDFHEDEFLGGAWQTRIDGSYVTSQSPIASTTVFTFFAPPNSANLSPVQISISQSGTEDQSILNQIGLVGINLLTQIKPSSPLTTINTLIELRNVAFDPTQQAGS
jgi:prepilin-type N-terminal cleavage/methylation domain-containing protein